MPARIIEHDAEATAIRFLTASDNLCDFFGFFSFMVITFQKGYIPIILKNAQNVKWQSAIFCTIGCRLEETQDIIPYCIFRACAHTTVAAQTAQKTNRTN